jgi:hypothetical protein
MKCDNCNQEAFFETATLRLCEACFEKKFYASFPEMERRGLIERHGKNWRITEKGRAEESSWDEAWEEAKPPSDKPVSVPEPYSSIIDNICEKDRLYFEAHPEATEYARLLCPGELYPGSEENIEAVIVRQVKPGLRVRVPQMHVLCSNCGRKGGVNNFIMYPYRGKIYCHECFRPIAEMVNEADEKALGKKPDVPAGTIVVPPQADVFWPTADEETRTVMARWTMADALLKIDRPDIAYAWLKCGFIHPTIVNTYRESLGEAPIHSRVTEDELLQWQNAITEYQEHGGPIAIERKQDVEPVQKLPIEALRQAGFFTEALEKQFELIDIWRGQKGEAWASVMHPGMMRAWGAAPSPKDIQRMEAHELENAEPYFVAKDICGLIEATASTIPDVPLLADMLPTPFGWVYLEKSCPLGPPSQVEVSPFGNPPRLKAFSWGLEYTKKAGQVTDGIGMTIYEDGTPVPYPLEILTWPFGTGSDWGKDAGFYATKVEEDVARKRTQAICRYILTLFSFLNQKLIAISHQRATRQARKRYENRWAQEAPLIKVVLLRVKEYRGKKGEGTEAEWSCRWIVRGHWRAQWYPSVVSHKAIWITPYIKGPEGKPLKKPAANLFAVVR